MRRRAVTEPARAEPPEEREDDGRVSLHPLTFEEAMEALLKTPPAKQRARKEAAPDEQEGHDGDGSS